MSRRKLVPVESPKPEPEKKLIVQPSDKFPKLGKNKKGVIIGGKWAKQSINGAFRGIDVSECFEDTSLEQHHSDSKFSDKSVVTAVLLIERVNKAAARRAHRKAKRRIQRGG